MAIGAKVNRGNFWLVLRSLRDLAIEDIAAWEAAVSVHDWAEQNRKMANSDIEFGSPRWLRNQL